jgi:aerobic carbon-monoxide dehydrogenase medium subunit
VAGAAMKPPPFEYDAPETLDEALALLAEHGDEAKVLAGGQSLVPLLNFRLVRPARLIDLNRVAELDRLADGCIGAMTRSRTLELESGIPLLRRAVRHSGHVQIRNRGTVGGSCAHADPASELPCALLALDARFRLRSAGGERVVAAEDFFLGAFSTALAPDELLVEIEVPPRPGGERSAFVEHARVHGDFAIAGAAVLRHPRERLVISMLGGADRPVRVELPDAGEEGAAEAVRNLDPPSDLRASGRYRKALLEELVRRAIRTVSG